MYCTLNSLSFTATTAGSSEAGSLEHELTLLSFIATYNKLGCPMPIPKITELSFTPLLSHRSTSMDSIFTTMKNFQDFFRQRNDHTGLCCATKGYIVSQNKYSNFDPMNLVIFGLEWVPSIAIGPKY